MSSYQMLHARVRLVRRRWRLKMLVKGVSLFLASSVVLLLTGVYGADLFGFESAAVWSVRSMVAIAALFAAFRFIYLPLRRRVTDLQVAQFVEERYPQLEDRLVSAIEFGRDPNSRSGMFDLLIRDALEKTNHLDLSVFSNHKHELAYAGPALFSLFILLGLISWGPPFFHFGFDRIYMPWTEVATDAGRTIVITPGDKELARGANQQIRAQLVGFDSPDVRLYVRPATTAAWSPLAMEPEPRSSGFLYLLVDLQSPLRYYAEAKGVRSNEYSIRLTDGQRVERIDLHYIFPDYTGMAAQTVENEGDISALKGTRVEVSVRVSQPVRSARLLFDNSSALSLDSAGPRIFRGSLILKRSGSYVVQLENETGSSNAGSPEYEIRALDDAPPRIAIAKPQRDLNATNVEEVFTEIKSEDDIGVGRVELHYSVNGGEAQLVRLYDGKPKQTAVTATRTFFLEEFGLHPGDLISYFGKAFDNNSVTGPGSTSSDIYFIQIRPFEQKYTQSQQGGTAGGGEAHEALSKQQKEIISATFKLTRDKGQMEPGEYSDGLKALALVQSRLQAQTSGLLGRLKRRGATGANEDFARFAGYLQAAAGEMEKAAVQLGAQKPLQALREEQRSLQQLLRADSLYREIQVSFAAQMNGAGGPTNAEDLAELFELELNKLKNQYETVQRGEQQARDQHLDEAMERLKELARRQQQLNEGRRTLIARGSGTAGGPDGGRGQRQLLEDAEKLRRQLQRLSRERSSPELNQVSSQLEKAIREMQQSLQPSGSRSLQEANALGIRALQQLEDARQALARGQQAGLSYGLEQALEESKQILEEQGKIQESVRQLIQHRQQSSPQEQEQRRDELSGRKSQFADRVRNLGDEIEDLSAAARKAQREASTRLNDAAAWIREKKLPERILSGNALLRDNLLDLLKGREDSVRAGLEEFDKQLEAAKGSIGQSRQEKLEDAVNRTRELAEGLESLRRQLEGGPEKQGGADAPKGRPGRDDPLRTREQSERQDGRLDQERQTGNGSPGPAGRGQNQGAGSSPAGIARPGDEVRRQWRREAQERLQDAQELRRLLDRNSTQMKNLEKVIEAVRDGTGAGSRDDGEMIARLRAAVDLLHAVDRDLSRELAQAGNKGRFFQAEDDEVPDSYRTLVEEYYRALARRKP